MKKVFKCLAVIAMLTVFANVGLAFDLNQHVKLSPDNKGDMMIFPFYFAANGGWETKITVVNTSLVHSTVAKIIFRSHLYSEELLDFLLYLTPADVWTGYIRNDGTRTYIYSEDGSALSSSTTFASKATPINQQIYTPRCTTTPHNIGDSADYGYIELTEAWYGDLRNYVPSFPLQTVNGAMERAERPASKTYLRRVYEAYVANNNGWNIALGAPGQPRANTIDDRTANILSGFIQFQNPLQNGLAAGMPATTFADYDCLVPLTVNAISGIAFQPARNTLSEVEAALARNRLSMPYVNNPLEGVLTVHLFNFPTKSSIFDRSTSTSADYCRFIDGGATGLGTAAARDFWDDINVTPGAANNYSASRRCINYAAPYYDLDENSPGGGTFSGGGTTRSMCQEVEILTTGGYSSLYTEGWTLYYFSTFTDNSVISPVNFMTQSGAIYQYDGQGTDFVAPVIGTVLEFVNGGLKLFEGAYSHGYTSTDAGVTRLWDYMYSNTLLPSGENSF